MTNTAPYNFAEMGETDHDKEETHNDNFWRSQALFGHVIDVLSVEPVSPADGDAYILGPTPTGGVWGSMSEHSVVQWYAGLWREYVPVQGWNVLFSTGTNAGQLWWFNGTAWAKTT